MTTQTYCMVDAQTNICDNVVVWDGNTETWPVPDSHLVLPQATTPSKAWAYNTDTGEWALQSSVGGGEIGFTWNGSELVTNEPMPTPEVLAPATEPQPVSHGAQNL